MKCSPLNSLTSTLLAVTLLLCAGPAKAVDSAHGQAVASAAAAGSAKPKMASPASEVKLVDINGASKAELMTLPGIRDAEADKIIAGRPYGSKAWLVTNKIVSDSVYQGLRTRIIARQTQKITVKPAAGDTAHPAK